MWRLILAAKKILSNPISPKKFQLMLLSTVCCISRHFKWKKLCSFLVSPSSFEMRFQLSSLRSTLNVSAALRQVASRTPWYAKRKSYKVLFWREITPLAVPIFLENTCVLLMGVLSTFLVSWLGKEAMAGVGLADSFNMVIMAFFAAIDLGTTVVVAFSLGKRDRRRARSAARQSLVIMTIFATVLAAVIHYFGEQIIDVVAGEATPDVKALALTYLELTVLSYPAAAIALIGSGALRGAGNTKIPLLINGGMNILNIIISSILIYGVFSWQGLGFVGAGLGLTISRYIGAFAIIWVLMIGFNPALRIPFKSYFKPLNLAIIWEVMGIGIPASIESVLFNGGKLLTQMFVSGMGTSVIAGNFIAFSIAALINLPGNALGSASTIITGRRLGNGQIAQAEIQLRHIFWLSTIGLTAIAWLTAPFAGVMASFYTHDQDVKEVIVILIWLNAAFMPIWAASWVLPSGFKGARDVRFAMWVSMLGMWGCRVVAGYTLGIVLGWGVVGVWLGMFFDWAVRAALFYWRMVTGRWLWKYPRPEREKCIKQPVASE
ncbi:EmmdR/YeeO family multidrug/toxin efflux MATE transporter [Citrobacter braakii]|uniref:EmmdR/YeeO family multidrug/toxin efflux MATE transporter n=2 Tax=Enterobacteriaceae TaxID=543 RepID=A0ABR6TRJ2_CITBR|nr:EmmdR/YeeO family multidrug/toxin efflux MATE transporter [Citrobacter braakii]MDM3431012.1 EmmdR/YeeO family multidrug/toxin efflux MATE transporter [Citrobacter sp. Cb023]MDM3435097.1 EmmdR/YeeO family multidrug/toxin efflux MATE transporter [Citrobacter sp. Cb034]MBC2609132.1 EmmdR/YeeO family multidrug/toxin efflux MATE transporter [Citrobacter braakii]MBC2633172.1 EmmdR/YeeO family multidrug/toxin efflux MATE transporter [Citrobacter braakii]